ncbi:arrestin domain-containing protein 3, partial [Nephila pilipes]
QARKRYLQILTPELGLPFWNNLKVFQLKDFITSSHTYEEEFVRNLLTNIIDEGKLAEQAAENDRLELRSEGKPLGLGIVLVFSAVVPDSDLQLQPFHCEIEDTLGIPCLNSGPVSCRVRLDRGGYVPGESICVFATIDNGSRVTIKKTKAILTE